MLNTSKNYSQGSLPESIIELSNCSKSTQLEYLLANQPTGTSFNQIVDYLSGNTKALESMVYLFENHTQNAIKGLGFDSALAVCLEMESTTGKGTSEDLARGIDSICNACDFNKLVTLSTNATDETLDSIVHITRDFPYSFNLSDVDDYLAQYDKEFGQAEANTIALARIYDQHTEEAIELFGIDTALSVFVNGQRLNNDTLINSAAEKVDGKYCFSKIKQLMEKHRHSIDSAESNGATMLKIHEMSQIFSSETPLNIDKFETILHEHRKSSMTIDELSVHPRPNPGQIGNIHYEFGQSDDSIIDLQCDGKFTIIFDIKDKPVACASFDVISADTAYLVQVQQIVERPVRRTTEEKTKYPRELRRIDDWPSFVTSTTLEFLKDQGFETVIIQGAENNINVVRPEDRIPGQESMQRDTANKIYDKTALSLGFEPIGPVEDEDLFISSKGYKTGNYILHIGNVEK